MKKTPIISLVMILWSTYAIAQAQPEIPVALKENAYSIVLNNQIDFVCESETDAVKKETFTVTIQNEKGKDAGNFIIMCDKFSSLSKFSGEVHDQTGKLIRKIKKSELQMSEYSSGLTTDDYTYSYECSAASYPYTVKYEWEIKYKGGLINYPSFLPQDRLNQSVVEATYRLHHPAGSTYRYKALNTDAKMQTTTTAEGLCEEITFKGLKALEQETYGPSLRRLLPRVYLAPNTFVFDGNQGDMSNWKSYGIWQYGLLADRDVLPPAFKEKLLSLTANCSTDKEKVKVIYDYLAANTRYVSIQLGIGGLQPAPAMDVHRTGFGDCKGLSNYMRAMLKELGITSYYTVISTDNARLLKDFSSANQMNHVILQVPLKNDTLWLECTNAQLPFGFIHSEIAGHDALLIKESGGELCRLPAYPDSLNTQVRSAQVSIAPTGKATIKTNQECGLFQYEGLSGISQLEPDKQKDVLRSQIGLTQASVSNVNIIEKKTANPSIDIQFQTECNQFGNKTGNRLFIPANVFQNHLTIPNQAKRTYDIFINDGYVDTDNISIELPEGYSIEAMPKPIFITNQFGTFTATVAQTGKEIQVIQRLFLKKGQYSISSYEEFTNFAKTVSQTYNGKIVLKKE